MDGDLDGGHLVGREQAAHDAFGQSLDEVHRVAHDDVFDRLGHRAVIDGVFEIVGPGSGSAIGEQCDVHEERLPHAFLLVEDPVIAHRSDPGDCDAVLPRRGVRCRVGGSAREVLRHVSVPSGPANIYCYAM